ncbi:MAG: isoaspartyl peptidase/L-asparaginase [Azospirillaceae bacterium]|nr:isoaspartyl peptidase/L-asparaginase [Azospirillaceae bacterium]
MAVIAVHGGAGTIPRAEIGEAGYQAARHGLRHALAAAWSILARGGSALDAVECAVAALEDDPSFNAGRGAVFNAAGDHELDAAIMDGATLAAGAVAATRTIRNPVHAARLVMDRSDCVMLVGAGADAFARDAGLEPVAPDYFSTPMRAHFLQRAKAIESGLATPTRSEAEKHGTVGAVALDAAGNLAAATSTGGYTNKRVGRVGDTPCIGAGTYARNDWCAVSCTGQGEFFMRHATAHDIVARMAYRGQLLETATNAAIFEDLTPHGCGAGLVAVDADGNFSMPFNTDGMYRGVVTADARLSVGVYRDDFSFLEQLS